MTAFPASRRLAAWAAALVLAAAPAAPASAETGEEDAAAEIGEPLRLGPVETQPTEGEPAAEAEPEPGADAAAEAGEPTRQGIEVDELGRLDPDAIGTLDPGEGGLGADLWESSERRVIAALLPRLPGELRSPTLRRLAHRLLLSSAAPPARRSVEGNGKQGNLLALRLERLAALGDIDGVIGLLRVVPERYVDAAMARHHVEALFLAHRPEPACRTVRNVIAEQHGKAFWQKALAVCQLRAGKPQAAGLTVALLREQETDSDRAFFALVDSYGVEAPQPPAFESGAGPLHVALYGALERGMPAAALEGAGAGVLAAVARHRRTALAVRARAAERAAAIGAVEPDHLGRIYAAFDFDRRQLAEAPSLAGGAGGLEGSARRALLFQAVRAERLSAPRAELVRLALAEARDAGVYRPMAAALAPQIADMRPGPELAWFAEIAGRALYAAGRFEAATAWHRLAREEAIVNPEAAVAVTSLWPYSRLAGAPALSPDGSLAAWRSAQAGAEDGAASLLHQQSVLRACLQGLGEPESVDWIDIALDGNGEARPASPAPLVYAMQAAADSGRRGEALLLALIVLGRDGPGETHPMVLSAVLTALAGIELEAEARALAVEAALANGI